MILTIQTSNSSVSQSICTDDDLFVTEKYFSYMTQKKVFTSQTNIPIPLIREPEWQVGLIAREQVLELSAPSLQGCIKL